MDAHQANIDATLELCHSGNEPSAEQWHEEVEAVRLGGESVSLDVGDDAGVVCRFQRAVVLVCIDLVPAEKRATFTVVFHSSLLFGVTGSALIHTLVLALLPKHSCSSHLQGTKSELCKVAAVD